MSNMCSFNINLFHNVLEEMKLVYLHDKRPWMIGYSGGKDSTLLVTLCFEMMQRIPEERRWKPIFVVSSDTGLENPVVANYMHSSNKAIGAYSKEHHLNIYSEIIYPKPEESFWTLVIGKGYPTPEPPGFRWCTERLKIHPMNRFVNEIIQKYGEVIILLGVRKGESGTRKRNIESREIEGKLLQHHEDIPEAWVFNPLTEIPNSEVWFYLLKNNGKTPWGTSVNQLYAMYQGESLTEEASVLGQLDYSKIPVTGNSRFGCWCCTIVKEDKSLQNFIHKGSNELIPLRDFRNWLVSIRQDPSYRESHRANGKVYQKSDGSLGLGPFKLEAREEILRRLLLLEKRTGFSLVSIEELHLIEKYWEAEGDFSRRRLVDLYAQITGKKLPWDESKTALLSQETAKEIENICLKDSLPFPEIMQCLDYIDKNKTVRRGENIRNKIKQILSKEYLHLNKGDNK